MSPNPRTFLSRSPVTGRITATCGKSIISHDTLREAVADALWRYGYPIVRILTRNPVTGQPTGWVVRARERHELSALALRTTILREQGKEAA